MVEHKRGAAWPLFLISFLVLFLEVTLIRWMLSLSPEERLAVLQGFVDSVAELTHDSPAAQVQRST